MNKPNKNGKSLLEETHYYPFGLTMAGISSKAAGKLENKKNKFQGQEWDDDFGINYYGFKWRNHDPQIGRFIEVDPLANDYVYNSTYAFSENKVTGHVELEGLEAVQTNTILYSNNGKSQILNSYSSNVDNPYNMGGGTLNKLTTIVQNPNGTQSISNTFVYQSTFMDRLKSLFSIGQLQVYGSATGGGEDGPGSKPDPTKPIESINMGEFGPLFDLVIKGSADPNFKPSLSQPQDFAKDMMDIVTDAVGAASKIPEGSSNNSPNTTQPKKDEKKSTKPAPVNFYYDGTPAKNEKGNGRGLRTSSDPNKPDTNLFDKPKQP